MDFSRFRGCGLFDLWTTIASNYKHNGTWALSVCAKMLQLIPDHISQIPAVASMTYDFKVLCPSATGTSY